MLQTVSVIGLGYIGLPTATVLALAGHEVHGVDLNEEIVESINRAELPFVEPDLDEALAKAVESGNLSAGTAVVPADVHILAVPTPIFPDESADLSMVEAATRSLALHLNGGELIILESTSPPGSTALIGTWIKQERPDLDMESIDLAHCPERVLPGQIMREIVANDRVVGGITARAAERAADLYKSFCSGAVIETDATTAEMAKLVENSFRDVNIAFANELSMIADKIGIDVWELIEVANHHPRVNILQPGPGVGGHCIAVDPWFIVEAAPDESNLIRKAREVNDSKPGYVVQKVVDAAAAFESPRIALLGLAFKKNVDDLRGSPSISIAARLAAALPHATLVAVEPYVDRLPQSLLDLSIGLGAFDEALATADVLVLLVDHDEFIGMDSQVRPGVAVIDTRGLWRKRPQNT